jgi:GcrA cell cycle regulator
MSGGSIGRPLWPEERDAQLRELWASGLSSAQMGLQLGVSRNAVIGRAHRLRLPPRKPTGPNGGRKKAQPRKRKHYIRRTNSSGQFVRETGELVENPHELLAPPVSLMALEPHHCRWPIDGEDGHIWYCGVTKCDGVSYCLTHARMAFTKAPAVFSDAERAKRAQAARNRKKAMVRAA